MLSLQTQAAGFDQSYDDLRRVFPTGSAVLDAPLEKIVATLRRAASRPRKRHGSDKILQTALEGAARQLEGEDWTRKWWSNIARLPARLA